MDKKELEKQISEMTKKAADERGKRFMKIFAVFAVVFFLLFYFFDKKPESIGDTITMIIVSIVLSALHCVINEAVFEDLIIKDELAQREISELRKQLSAIQEKEYDEMIKKLTKERDANVR